LLTGGTSLPGTGSEWNELLYRVSGEQFDNRPNWDTYNNTELNMGTGNGRVCWVQEKLSTTAVTRGLNDLTDWNEGATSASNQGVGWRPVLE
jgi:hypothetical protein